MDLVVEKFELEMEKKTESEQSDYNIESLESDHSSNYLDPDLGKLDVPESDYLPSIIKYAFEYQSSSYSPLKLAPKAPNQRMEPEPPFNRFTFDEVLSKLGFEPVGAKPTRWQISRLLKEMYKMKLRKESNLLNLEIKSKI